MSSTINNDGNDTPTTRLAAKTLSNRGCIQVKGAKPLTSLSLSPSHDHAVVVGRSLFRLVKLDLEYERLHEMTAPRTGRKNNLSASSTCVDWHPMHENIIATAASNGVVVLWNLDRQGQETVKQAEYKHAGAAHAVHWHPDPKAHPNWLLSCARQNVVKLWDTRVGRHGSDAGDEGMESGSSTFKVGVPALDVRFSHHDPNQFAAAMQNNQIQIWDVRHGATPLLRYRNLHNSRVYCVRWHPTIAGRFATGSRDHSIKVFDISDVKAEVTSITTASTVNCIAWRGGRFPNQLVSTNMLFQCQINVWDLRQRFFPIGELAGHTNTVNDVAFLHRQPGHGGYRSSSDFHSDSSGHGASRQAKAIGDHLLISCSKDGSVQLHDVKRAEQPIMNICNASMSISARGDVASCIDPVNRKWRGQIDATVTDPPPKARIVITNRAEEEFVDRCAFGIAQQNNLSQQNSHHVDSHSRHTSSGSQRTHHHHHHQHQHGSRHRATRSSAQPRKSIHLARASVQGRVADTAKVMQGLWHPQQGTSTKEQPLLQENRDFDGEEELFDHASFEYLALNYRLCPDWGACDDGFDASSILPDRTSFQAAGVEATHSGGGSHNGKVDEKLAATDARRRSNSGAKIIQALCAHNAKVAERAELPVQASTWYTLACLFEPAVEDANLAVSSHPSPALQATSPLAVSSLMTSPEVSMFSTAEEKFARSVEVLPGSHRRLAANVQQETVRSIVEHYGARGHCQMVVTMLCVLASGGWNAGKLGSLLGERNTAQSDGATNDSATDSTDDSSDERNAFHNGRRRSATGTSIRSRGAPLSDNDADALDTSGIRAEDSDSSSHGQNFSATSSDASEEPDGAEDTENTASTSPKDSEVDEMSGGGAAETSADNIGRFPQHGKRRRRRRKTQKRKHRPDKLVRRVRQRVWLLQLPQCSPRWRL